MKSIAAPKRCPSPVKKQVPHGMSALEFERLKELTNKHKDQRGFLIGGGSSLLSLQKADFDFSRLQSEVIIGVNKAYKLVTPTYLVFGDNAFLKNFTQEIYTLPCVKFAPHDILRGYGHSTLYAVQRGNRQSDILPRGLSAPISFINNSGVGALRITYTLGCNPIYLLGIDLTVNAAGETHFHEDYKAIGRKTRPESYTSFQREYIKVIVALRAHHIEVISCSPISKLNDIIPYIPIEEVLDHA
jgi:hypothetical protein